MTARQILIFDTTLRDGEQAPGNSLSGDEKLRLARQLDALGVDVIEAGFPAASDGDYRAVRDIAAEIRRPTIAALARCHDRDIDLAGEALRGAERGRLHVFISTSELHMRDKLRLSPREVLDRTRAAIRRARRFTDDVEFSAEDASRSDPDFLCRIVEAAIAEGATTINLPDTVGYALPDEYAAMFCSIRDRVPSADRIVFSAHCHDDLGLAVANTLAAIAAGVGQVECTINGIGERAGNAALEEVVMAGRVRAELAFDCGVEPRELYRTSQLLSFMTGVIPQPNKAIVGRNAFAHESGIHQHGMLCNGRTYEIIAPESVGIPRSTLVLGKHSGRHALERRYADLGYTLNEDQLAEIYRAFTALADRKREILDEDLLALLHESFRQAPEAYQIKHLRVVCGDVQATADVRMMGPWAGERTSRGTGDGPIAAAFTAISDILGCQVEVLDLALRSLTPGRDSVGQVFLKAKVDGKTLSGQGTSTDIVEASARALVNALDKARHAEQLESTSLNAVYLWGAESPMTEASTGAQLLCRTLLDQGVHIVFGYPGGAIMPFYHALPEYPALRHVLVRHEQAAAHAADGYARATGRPGVCVATSGPGATNLVTGLATAYMDSTPVVAITGQVSRAMIGRDAFQETDIIGITQPITKHNRQVEDIEELEDAIHEAFAVATEGRPGPVLVDVPKDVQNQLSRARDARVVRRERTTGSEDCALVRRPGRPFPAHDPHQSLHQAAELLAGASRPVIMAGHGIVQSRAYDELRNLAEHADVPIITTLLGISSLPVHHPLHLGMPGMHGDVHVNRAIQHADVILGVGLRFDDRVTGNVAGFARNARVIHVDLDPAEIAKNVPVEVAIVGDARDVLARLIELVPRGDHGAWRAQIAGYVRPRHEPYRDDLSPERILDAIAAATDGRCTIVSDVGQHQMWVAKHYRYQYPNSHITSGGLGTMGFAVPAAMGVQLARPGEPVWAISGDGGYQMNLQELATMVQEAIPVKMAIFNNGYLGMVRQWQQFFHGRRYSATPIGSPDYVRLAEAYGIPGSRVERAADALTAVRAANEAPGPAVVEFVIEQEANVYPMIPPGASLSEPIEAAPAEALHA